MPVSVSYLTAGLDLIDGGFDLSRLEALSLPDTEALGQLLSALDSATITSLSPTEAVLSSGSFRLVLTGNGLGPQGDPAAFLTALNNGTSTGQITGLSLRDGAQELFSTSLSASAISVQLGALGLTLTGTLPASLQDLIGLLSDPAGFAAYDLDAVILRENADELLRLTLGDGSLTLAMNGYTLTAMGSLPEDPADIAGLLLGAALGGTPDPETLEAISLDSLVLRAPGGQEIMRAEGDLLDMLLGDEGGMETTTVDGQPFDLVELDLENGGGASSLLTAFTAGTYLAGLAGDDTLRAEVGGTLLDGGPGNDRLEGSAQADTLQGGDGSDTLIGGAGDDVILGGTSMTDLRDVVFGGEGNDTIDGGYGNDELRGDAGDDSIAGGFGADTVIGGVGNDTLTGSAFGDEIFGGDGMDFVNGGFGSDRVNGGTGGDTFFHLGIADHGSDWIQDYNAADGDVLAYGGNATRDQFQINVTTTPTAGADDVQEAFVIYRPTGQILWALVDGDGQAEINLRLNGQVFDLTA
ncbi:calcium-binding protein [Jannaschia sp. M317]|uniref:calcium-binding protein n=1 Tax=Jannaschia sp. M317 TaxID=2867011 RepID=UPI0021A51B04|nr:hypothetical protein [Jannaschia sp. M317]UWQ19650.1 hypothetical protein K3551_18330 [Jannaschia sp. M317]